MEKNINAWAAKRAGCKVREPTQNARTHAKQNARAHAKCADPRKVRGPTQSAWAALWVQGAPSARTCAKCVGRGSIARAALSARAAIAWRGEWAALPSHLSRTCHSMPTQCNRGSTRVGRDELQSPGTLRASILHLCIEMVPQVHARQVKHRPFLYSTKDDGKMIQRMILLTKPSLISRCSHQYQMVYTCC